MEPNLQIWCKLCTFSQSHLTISLFSSFPVFLYCIIYFYSHSKMLEFYRFPFLRQFAETQKLCRPARVCNAVRIIFMIAVNSVPWNYILRPKTGVSRLSNTWEVFKCNGRSSKMNVAPVFKHLSLVNRSPGSMDH